MMKTRIFGLISGVTFLMVSVSAFGMPVLNSQINFGGTINSIGYDDLTGNLYIHQDFDPNIRVINQSGLELATIAAPGANSNDFDMSFTSSAVSINGISVAANSLLVFNGDDNPETLTALNKNTGVVLASLTLPSGSLVGGAYHSARGSLFTVDYLGNDLVNEINPDTGVVVNSFSSKPPEPFDVDYGDIDVYSPTGNLFIVSSSQNVVREFTADGTFVRDIDVNALGISGMSGIAIDAVNDIAWITAIDGNIYEVANLFTPVPVPAAVWFLLSGGMLLGARRKST